MGKHGPADIRNVAFVGAGGTGKTSLCEAILFRAGVIGRMGTVPDGTTVSDTYPDEHEKQHSIRLACMYAEHGGVRYQLLDAPGYPDYVGEACAALAASETAVLCLNGHHGLTFQDVKRWQHTVSTGRAHAVVITHVDQECDFDAFLKSMHDNMGARFLPVTLPKGTGPAFDGVAAVPLDGSGEGPLGEAAAALVEAAVEIDEEAMMRFLEEDVTPSREQIVTLVRRSMVTGDIVPVFAVCGTDARGVDEFLDFAREVFPSPLDGPGVADVSGAPVTADAEGNSAFVFKTIIDPYVGKLCLLRVVSGELHAGQNLTVPRTGKSVRLSNLQVMQGKDHTGVDKAVAGDIIAVAKLEDVETSDTLAEHTERVFAPVAVPPTMAARSIEPENHADDVKLATSLRRAASEDPTFTFERHEATGELVVHGVTAVHIETHLRRITDLTKVAIKVKIPRVPLKETITSAADGHHRHKKQTGGRGQFAEVFLTVKPGERGSGLVFVDDTVGGSVPKQYIPAVEKGIHEVMKRGIIAGYPVVDVAVHLTDGKFHDVDSDEASFKMAGGRAFKDAFQKARPVLLEPLLDVEVAVPSEYMGAITSDMTGRRGHISGMDSIGSAQIVKARVPQKEVLTYPTVLNSLTHGQGSFSSHFHDYEVMPPNVQQEVMAEYKPADEED
ncbi:MAG: elongation factor G [Planctomycetes bacterium]|nr:elongation factor G [Planctomycetota bacterium]